MAKVPSRSVALLLVCLLGGVACTPTVPGTPAASASVKPGAAPAAGNVKRSGDEAGGDGASAPQADAAFASLFGIVYNAESKPVKGATIKASLLGEGTFKNEETEVETSTDEFGIFHLTEAPVGETVRLAVSYDGKEQYSRDVKVAAAGGTPDPNNLEFGKAPDRGITISGRIYDGQGMPVDATVEATIVGGGTFMSGQTVQSMASMAGIYAIAGVPAGKTVRLTVSRPGLVYTGQLTAEANPQGDATKNRADFGCKPEPGLNCAPAAPVSP